MVRNTGKGPATAVVLTLDELEDLVYATSDLFVRERLLCANRAARRETREVCTG
jgi:hypothetical protein